MIQGNYLKLGGNMALFNSTIVRKFSDKVKENSLYRPLKNDKLTYRALDNNALKMQHKQEYLRTVKAQEYNLRIKKQRESIRDHYFRSNFNEFMRSRKYFSSHWDRARQILIDDWRDAIGTLDLSPTLKLDNNGNLIKETDTPFEMISDVVIIGGGMVGASIAYHIKRLLENDIKVTIIDKDFSYRHAATSLSFGGLKQQFSLKQNIELAKYAAAFLDNVKEELSYQNHIPEIAFNYCGFLTLADKEQLKEMEDNFKILSENDVEAKLLYKKDLQYYFPWMDADGIEAGILGVEQEGWFDHRSLLDSLHRKCTHLGAEYVVGEVVESHIEQMESKILSHGCIGDATRITSIQVRMSSGRTVSIPCGIVVLAAGMNSSQLGKDVFEIGAIDIENSIFKKKLPIYTKRHFVYNVHIKKGLGLNCPIVMAPNGTLFRRDGLVSTYVCQTTPPPDVPTDDTSMKDYFNQTISPSLKKISKSFKDFKILSCHAAYSDYNEFDHNPLIGFHRGVSNMFIASGFNNSSVNALGVGNYFMEKVLCQEFTIDLTNLTSNRYLAAFDRYKVIDKCVH